MPRITLIKCDHCGLAFPEGWGSYEYVLNHNGKRILYPHPTEEGVIWEISGMDPWMARTAGRTGFSRFCMCFDCVEQIELDLDRDEKKCPKCGSLKVHSANGAIVTGRIRTSHERAKFEQPGLLGFIVVTSPMIGKWRHRRRCL
ncbi:MAG: hypothetical protein ABSG53_28490, partial [Thermoguttaceae bacterium]